MPSKPRSSSAEVVSELSRVATLMNSAVLVTPALLANTRTAPVFCTTNQRESSPGACNMATGCVNPGVILGNTRCQPNVNAGASPARQVAFDGRLSRPPTGALAPGVVALACAEGA